jgi:hypothetical protein
MSQIFPDSRYIARQGRGISREAAELDGAAQIARFFDTQISTQLRVEELHRERNGVAQSITEVEVQTFISSQMNLFGIRYATDAYYDRRSKEWVTVAYINRDEAWRVYLSGFRQQAEVFNQLFLAAESETNPFRKALRFISARDYVSSPDFQNANIFGQILHPARMDEEFAGVRSQIARLPQLLDSARRNAPVFIYCPNDFESMVTNAFSREFSALGFPVANARNSASAICNITITEGRQQRELGIFYHPTLRAVISSGEDVLFTITLEGERSSAVIPDVAKRRAFQSLADKIREGFSLSVVN